MKLHRRQPGSRALREGSLTLLPATDSLLDYRREHGADHKIVLINFSSEPVAFESGTELETAISSDGQGEGLRFHGEVGPNRALILA